MNKAPTLVLLAAGMGSRFGGPKQITPVDDFGNPIINFSLYDAYRAGFRDIAFIVNERIKEDIREVVGKNSEKLFNVKYIYQHLDMIPEGCTIPEGRVKPWGTGHAVSCCYGQIDGPFAVINADDFYGPTAYDHIYKYLTSDHPENDYAMVAYELSKTVTENGYVARGICETENGFLTSVTERTHIEKEGTGGKFTEDEGKTWEFIPGKTPVSMNFWGFGPSMLKELHDRFGEWFDENTAKNPLKCEYFLPTVTSWLINEGKARVKVLNCKETWHGVTYKEDLGEVKKAIQELRDKGIYPEKIFE